MTTSSVAMRRNQNIYRQPAVLKLGPISASFLVITIVGVLALLYLNQITKTSLLGAKLTNLSNKQSQIVAQQETLNVEAARLQSIQQLEASSTVSQMVPASNVTYAQ